MSNVLYGDDGLQSMRLFFHTLITIDFLKDTLPKKLEDIPIVDVYQDDWKAQLKDQDEAWIITPLHYFTGSMRIHRKAAGGGTWNNRDQKEKNYQQATWCVRKFKFVESTNDQQATNDGTGFQKYTMMEYSPKEDKPTHALCRITVDNKKSAHDTPPSNSQQPKIMELDHTDSNNGERGETSLSHESMQIGGNFENTTGYYHQSDLEMFFARVVQGGELSEFMKHVSKDYVVQVFSRMMDQIPAASPKEHSTEAALRNPRKRSHGTTMKTIMEADVSTQRKKQAKVEIIGLSATIDHEPEFANSPSSVNQNNGQQIILLSNNSGYNQMFESDSEKEEKSSHLSNYNGTSTSSAATFEQWIANPRSDKDTLEGLVSSCSTHHDGNYKLDHRPLVETEGQLDQQVFDQNVQAPHNFYNFNANSIEPTENRYYLASYNQNIIPPGPTPTPTYYAPTVPPITDQSTYNASEEQQFSLCNTQHGQMFELEVYGLEPNKHNINAPCPSTSDWRTTDPENMNLINNMDLSYCTDFMDFINNDKD